ncbi:hypothetical protein [Flavobacterium sp. N502540]|uniref:hypothetical protein n=1 Tax=Flavobacterium sp. N502540 TaxID=2986838 RepID=UPI002224500E|nr:hypothetical protein [Flavobacterium sp. N502540]
MKKILLSFLVLGSLVSCSNDEGSVISDKAAKDNKNELFIRSTDGKIVEELPTEVYNKIIDDLQKDNEVKKIEVLNSEYKNDNGLTKLVSTVSKATKGNLTGKAEGAVTFQYKGHTSDYYYKYSSGGEGYSAGGWQNWVDLGKEAGTTGVDARLEALQFTSGVYINDFKARAYVQNLGWLPYVGFGEVVGTTGRKLRMESLQIFVPASFATNVYYQVHVQNLGWLPVVGNGEITGTTGRSLRIEAFKMYMFIVI